MQLRNNWKVLTIAVLAVVFGSSLLLAGNYAVTKVWHHAWNGNLVGMKKVEK